ncbi:glutathione S-transferase family protein [Vibrio sp. SS-MA-C1-2]|uniref:glutathione S-transferase family protein n=1 Tax=Vibrio sp. SS-MA-C1-2 TaxID=2908646 RepID=UPI001F3387EB|nr:glutathione S-transferase family protein [Vibrio sp. SS-MA-C1-2]UJF18383.1 glutathione S-transferase family protein [Vibrio sp. SS-MA-C1-2]
MAIIKPKNKRVESFEGIHLYHASFSNCAMRVRLTLEEKGLPWTSHLLNLMKGEHLTDEYIGINPNAVVPTLVDNGVVIIDSADIIDYLDDKYNHFSLRPAAENQQKEMFEWMYLARDNHLSIKTYMYGNIDSFGSMKKSSEELAEYQSKQTFDEGLLKFHQRFNSDEGFSAEELQTATAIIDDCFAKMNQRLKDHDWLVGDAFSLADIAWIPQLIILKMANYPFENYPHLEAWKQAIFKRPSYQRAILDWIPQQD